MSQLSATILCSWSLEKKDLPDKCIDLTIANIMHMCISHYLDLFSHLIYKNKVSTVRTHNNYLLAVIDFTFLGDFVILWILFTLRK